MQLKPSTKDIRKTVGYQKILELILLMLIIIK